MLSIITVVNNIEVYEKHLKRSILQQDYDDYELIVVKNFNNRIKSLSNAYREGINKSKGNNYLFIHPDVTLLNNHVLTDIMNRIEKCISNDSLIKIIGVAGADFGTKGEIYSTIVHGVNKTKFPTYGELMKLEYKEVQTLDACLFFISKSFFENNDFSEKINGFHFFIEELCLRNNKNGFKNVVIPSEIWHYSSGSSMDYTYYINAIRVIHEFKDVKCINTSCFQWKNSELLRYRLIFYMIRNFIHHRVLIRGKENAKIMK